MLSDYCALFIAFFAGLVIMPFVIKLMNRLRADQTEREYIESHKKKNGTPTMGGIGILAAFLISSLIFAGFDHSIFPVIILTVGFGAIGFIDDYLKVVLKRTDGLLWWQKLLLQIVFTLIFGIMIARSGNEALYMMIPFTGGRTVNPGWIAWPILFFAVIGTVNGTNFTDGLDGLASSVTVPVALFFAAAAFSLKTGYAPAALAMVGALMAFLFFNSFPAKIFMGDTGSLALGGFVAGMAYALKMPLFILIVGFIYLIEVVSVILQVGYFKATHGKRLFRMAPIHHHFELLGWSETRVVNVFTIVTALLSVIGWMAM